MRIQLKYGFLLLLIVAGIILEEVKGQDYYQEGLDLDDDSDESEEVKDSKDQPLCKEDHCGSFGDEYCRQECKYNDSWRKINGSCTRTQATSTDYVLTCECLESSMELTVKCDSYCIRACAECGHQFESCNRRRDLLRCACLT